VGLGPRKKRPPVAEHEGAGMGDTIEKHQAAWNAKPALRAVYRSDIFRQLAEQMLPGPTLEIGAGPGLLKAELPHIISSDIVPRPHLELAGDAHILPFPDGSLRNVVGVDVVHHFYEPQRMLAESVRVLAPGGRIVLSEPWITPVSRLVYRHFHHEGCEHVDDPLACAFPDGEACKDPWIGNAMIPYLLFGRSGRNFLRRRFPELRLALCRPGSALAYPLTRGFQPAGIRSEQVIRIVMGLEKMLSPLLLPLMAFRALIVLEKTGPGGR